MLMDIYALAPKRSAETVEQFLARFLPQREQAAADYSVQVGGYEPTRVFGTPEELTAFCESQTCADGRAYWINRKAGDPHSAHVFFLSDGGLVLGISVVDQDEAVWDWWLDELKEFAGASYGYRIFECQHSRVCRGGNKANLLWQRHETILSHFGGVVQRCLDVLTLDVIPTHDGLKRFANRHVREDHRHITRVPLMHALP